MTPTRFKLATADRSLTPSAGANCAPIPAFTPIGNRSLKQARASRDIGGNTLRSATSTFPYLQGFRQPPAPQLRDAVGKSDPDFFKMFSGRQPNANTRTFQSGGLIITCSLNNTSDAPISIAFLNRSGAVIANSPRTVQPGRTFIYPRELSNQTFYIRITSRANGQNAYELNLPIINS